MCNINKKLEWKELNVFIHIVESYIDAEKDKPLLKIEYNPYAKSDPWTIDILGIRQVTRDYGISPTHVEAVKDIAMSMLYSVAQRLDEYAGNTLFNSK